MLIYVTDLGKTGKICLYHPNTKDECTREFMRFFVEFPFGTTTEEEREEFGTEAMYKTDEETFMYWRELLAKWQEVSDRYEEMGMLDQLKLKGLPVYVPSGSQKPSGQ
jgi:hypothetical protein